MSLQLIRPCSHPIKYVSICMCTYKVNKRNGIILCILTSDGELGCELGMLCSSLCTHFTRNGSLPRTRASLTNHFAQHYSVPLKATLPALAQHKVLRRVWSDSHLLSEVSLYLVNHTGQFLYSWFQATKEVLVYPGRWESMRTRLNC